MTKKNLDCGMLFILLCCFTNCSTIIQGSRQSVVIVSEPRKAQITIDGMNVGNTPFVAKLARRNKHLVRIEMAGFIPYEITLTRKVNAWIFGNILIGGVIGIAVDAATGAMFKLSPKDIAADLQPTSAGYSKDKDDIYLTVVLKPNENWEKIGQLEAFNQKGEE